MSVGSPSQQHPAFRTLSLSPFKRCTPRATFHTHLACLKLNTSLFLRCRDKAHWWVLLALRPPWLRASSKRGWRFHCIFSSVGEQKGAFNVNNSVTDWSTGGCIKVVGLGTRASSALQFCYESTQLPSAEFWVSSGDGAEVQSFGLLNKNHAKFSSGQALQRVGNIIVFVLGMGANLCGKEALEILQSSRPHVSLSVMILIQPFNFEGPKRKKEVEEIAGSLLEQIDLCLVFEHDVLFKRERVTLAEALRVADSTVLYAIKALSDLTSGNQLKVFDAPPGGLRDVSNSKVISILGHAGNVWAGFASSYSIKSAVQRAAKESPFLQGLIPGMKGLVACTITSAEEKGRKDIQTALYALRCTIGPRAQLVCTSVLEPTLKRGLVLATILLTRIENGGANDVSKLYQTSADGSSHPNLYPSGSTGNSTSMNGRELRKTSMESLVEDSESKPLPLPKLQEAKEPISLEDMDNSEEWDPLRVRSACNSDVSSSTSAQINGQNILVNDEVDTIKLGDPVLNLVTLENDDILPTSSPSSGLQGLSTSYQSTFERALKNEFEGSPSEAAENVGLDDSSQASLSADFEGQIDFYEKRGAASVGEDSVLEKDSDGKWRFPSLSSIIQGGREMVNSEKKSLFGWESGPYSAAAEAWARTRQRLGSLGALEKNKSFDLPIGVRAAGFFESESNTYGREEGKYSDSAALSTFAAPLKRVLSSSLEAVADMCNAASDKIFKKDENDEAKQVSSFLSERAASMLESERSSMKLPPMIEMQYKNGTYRGRCQGGLPEGKGRLSYKDGSFYYGLWKQGKRAGIGSFYYANGDVFQGYWRDDQKHGKGWFYFHTGDRLYADFWKGKANGEGRYYSAKGDVFFGYFKENWRHGESLSIESGVRWSEVWDQGVRVSRTRVEDLDQS